MLLVTSSACGGESSDKPAAAKTSETATPRIDRGSKAAAQKVLDEAFDRHVAANRGHYRSFAEFGEAGVVFTEGRYDIKAKSGVWRLVQPALGRDGGENDEFAMRGMAVGRHVYGGPEFGPFRKCWFDYGTDTSALQATGEAENDTPWYPQALVVASEARPLGFINGNREVIAVEIFADSALSILFTKMLRTSGEPMPEDQVWIPATLALHDGTYSRLTFSVGEAIDALEDAGVDLDTAGDDGADLLGSAMQTTTYDRPDSPAPIKAPPADELIDATKITSSDSPDPEPCAAAR